MVQKVTKVAVSAVAWPGGSHTRAVHGLVVLVVGAIGG
jgi:hypothetical protein